MRKGALSLQSSPVLGEATQTCETWVLVPSPAWGNSNPHAERACQLTSLSCACWRCHHRLSCSSRVPGTRRGRSCHQVWPPFAILHPHSFPAPHNKVCKAPHAPEGSFSLCTNCSFSCHLLFNTARKFQGKGWEVSSCWLSRSTAQPSQLLGGGGWLETRWAKKGRSLISQTGW